MTRATEVIEVGTRRDVMQADADRDSFIRGCVELSNTSAGITALQVNDLLEPQIPNWQMRGDGTVELSWWDLFVLWHYVTMSLPTQGRMSNRAHGGPVFLPWHRMFLLRLEEVLQDVLGNDDFALPYWDWARDRQLGSALWSADRLGRNRGAVTAGEIGRLRVRLTGQANQVTGRFLEAHQPRPINREAGLDPRFSRLSRKHEVSACLREDIYDGPSWDIDTIDGLRNRLEGWAPNPPRLHNLVHAWLGGDMGPGTSPNDPVFYLNHCNADRIWEAWMLRVGGRTYVPDGTAANGNSAGHNLNDTMVALLGQSMTPVQVLDPSTWYDYDNLNVEV